jgi:gas vesicle protein
MKLLKFLLGFMVGMSVGWVIGLLLAPQQGEEIRASACRRVQQIIEEGRRAAAQRRAELEAQFQASKSPRPANKHMRQPTRA